MRAGILKRIFTKKTSQDGFTLVELVLAILLLAVAAPPMMQVFAELSDASVESETIPMAMSLGSQLMEEIKSTRFDELSAKDAGGNWSKSLGVNTGEVNTDKSMFDDVDDFNGWSQNFGASYPGFTASVTVSYVNPANLSLAVAIPNPVPSNWTPDYKLISVTVNNANLSAPIKITTLVTEVQSL